MTAPPTLYVLDGTYYVFRAFYAVRGMSNSKGLPTNGIFAFTNMLLNVIREHQPDYLAVAFDPPGKTFRSEIYPEYKANRDDPPEDLIPQFPYFREIVRALNIPIIEVPGYEADDAIGTLVRRAERDGMKVTILSGDKDLYQLLDDDTVMVDSMRNKVVDVAAVLERFSVEPNRVADVLGFAGDTSDNIPGVPGIGEKTAGALIKQFGSMEAVLDRVDEVTGKKRKENLVTYREQALMSRDLAVIRTNVPIEVSFDDLRLSAPDLAAFDRLCVELEFNRFRNEVRELYADQLQEVAPVTDATTGIYRAIMSMDALDACIDEIRRAGVLSVDLETTSVDPLEAQIVGVALAWSRGEGVYVPVGHQDIAASQQLTCDAVLDRLRPLLEDPSLPKVGQNTKYELSILRRYGVELAGVSMDTMLAAYLIDPNKRRYGMDALAQEYLNIQTISYADVTGTGKTQRRFDEVSVEEATPYAAEDADVTLQLARVFEPMLNDQGMRSLHDDVEVPLAAVLSRMESAGIQVDATFLGELSREFSERIVALEREIHEAAGQDFMVSSPKQLGVILFEKLGLPVIRKTKTGPSTDQAVLEQLRSSHPVVALVEEYRQLTKLVSTYVDTLPRLIRPETGRVHTNYNQAVAATGRLSSSDPNLQNIPIRSEAGRRIRQAFVPQEGWTLVGGDYSQIELRVLAHMSGEPVLIQAFRDGEDIHKRTASELFGVPMDGVSPDQRAAAKTINFGVIYGMGSNRLAGDLSISRSDAKAYIDQYFNRIGSVRPFFDRLIEDATRLGYAETLIGRRRPIPELQGGSKREQALGERLAINTPIQGTSADLIKLAMVNIDARMRAEGMRSRMLLQVHDELVFEAPDDEIEVLVSLAKSEMENVTPLAVPLRVDFFTGRNWAELK